VLVVALSMRLWGIEWQLPAALYFDEMKYVAWAGDAKDDASQTVTDLRNPTLFHHLLQIEYAVASVVQRSAAPQQIAVAELWLARLTSAMLGALACMVTALAARSLAQATGYGRRDAILAGLAAGLILALAPLHVHLSHYAVNDATASLFLAAALLFGTRVLASGAPRDLALAGLAAGLAFSTKYSFAVGLILPVLAIWVAPSIRAPQHCEGGDTREGIEGPPDQTSSTQPTTGSPPPRASSLGASLAAPIAGMRALLIVLAAFIVGAVLGAPEIIVMPDAVIAGLAEQARLGSVRWNGQSGAPIWQLYLETLGHGLGWPALAMALIGGAAVGWRNRWALVGELAVLAVCLGVMLRQELFFARFALPLLPSLAILAGLGVTAVVGLARRGPRPQPRAAVLVGLAAIVTGGVLLPESLTSIRHNQLASTTDTRVLARRWLQQRGDGSRVATELYGQPLLWAGSIAPRGFRLQRVGSFVDPNTVTKLACDGTRLFLVASLTSEREIARRGPRAGETGYDLLARLGQVKAVFDPYQPGQSAPAHPDNTGIPFWYLGAYARPGPKITVYELPEGAITCPH
jgi:hypothetical protein